MAFQQQAPRLRRPDSFRPGMAQPIQPQSAGTQYGRGFGRMDMGAYGKPMVSGFAKGALPTQAFTSTAVGFDGSQMDPSQFYKQRDALIQLLNDDNAQYQPYSGMRAAPGPAPRAPDVGALWGMAGDMVNSGWTNPFAARPQ